jgi:DNA-dependent RNA polymerase
MDDAIDPNSDLNIQKRWKNNENLNFLRDCLPSSTSSLKSDGNELNSRLYNNDGDLYYLSENQKNIIEKWRNNVENSDSNLESTWFDSPFEKEYFTTNIFKIILLLFVSLFKTLYNLLKFIILKIIKVSFLYLISQIIIDILTFLTQSILPLSSVLLTYSVVSIEIWNPETESFVKKDFINSDKPQLILSSPKDRELLKKVYYTNTFNKINDEYYNLENLINNKKIIKIFLNTMCYKSINEILIKNELTDYEMQFEIETFYFYTFKNKIDKIIRSSNLFNTNIGFKLLNKSIKDLDEKLNLFKVPKFLKNKNYAWVIANLSNSVIISTTFSILIPIIYKNDNLFNQNYVNILYKVGKSLYKAYLSEHYFNYLKIFNEIKNNENEKYLEGKITDYKIIDKLSNKNIIIKIDNKDKIEYQDFINKICFSEILDDHFYDIGHDIIQFLNLTTDYINIEIKNMDKKHKKTIITPGKSIENLLDISLLDVSCLPMIYKPNNWIIKLSNEVKENNNIKINDNIKLNFIFNNSKQIKLCYKIIKFGGYLINIFDQTHFIHKNPINAGKLNLINLDIIKTINYIQSIPFIININVLEHILNWIIEDRELNDPLFFKKHKETNKLDDYKKNKDLFKVNEILRQDSLFNVNVEIIASAILLRNKTFYHPIFSDWRGRIYTCNTILSFQGNELNRSLLYFKNGNILNNKGYKSLQIYTANCFGLNKLSNNYKIKWVNDNINKIIELNYNLINGAKEKLIFLACCYELKGYYNDPQNFISRLPIYLDATASGLQNLSVMTKDLNLAKYVNILKSSSDDIPKDIYTVMAKKVSDIVDEMNEYNPYKEIKKLLIDKNREFLKWAIMTTTYGVTLRGIKDQLIENIFIKTSEKFRYIFSSEEQKIEKFANLYRLKDIKYLKEEYRDEFEKFKLNGTEIMYLAKIIYNTLYDTYPSLKLLVNYFNDINDFLNLISLEIGIVWKTPSGLILEQKYLETISQERTRNVLGRRKSYVIQKTISKVNKRKQKQGTIANLIHSMDASNISLLVNNFIKNNKNINLATVHDCFLTDSNNIEMLHFHVRLAFLRIYQNHDFIESFHNNLINYLKNLGIKFNDDNTQIFLNDNTTLDLPNKPNFNDNLDLKYNLFNSPYFLI